MLGVCGDTDQDATVIVEVSKIGTTLSIQKLRMTLDRKGFDYSE
jgi:hypothetical protein